MQITKHFEVKKSENEEANEFGKDFAVFFSVCGEQYRNKVTLKHRHIVRKEENPWNEKKNDWNMK